MIERWGWIIGDLTGMPPWSVAALAFFCGLYATGLWLLGRDGDA